MKLYRQGDLLIKEVNTLPDNLLEVKSGVILEGEATGHKHRITHGKLFKDSKDMMFFDIPQLGFVVHEEHNPIRLAKGHYAVIRQREYTSENMTKLIVD